MMYTKTTKTIVLFGGFLALILVPFFSVRAHTTENVHSHSFEFQAIDTMKYSRDVAREKLKDSSFDAVIERQIQDIASTGATHVGIATPYDAEFLPFLKRWVSTARDHGLKVWFRGNWSGWEKWFGYAKISRAAHIEKTKQFIIQNPDLFEDGDVFSACPECENGGPGDPRMNGDAKGHRKFLIDEYTVTKKAFQDIRKNVASNYLSMNGDVARLIMDTATTKALDGIVTIDHYVKTPEKLDKDITDIAKQSGGQVILGEWGAPIPDIHGKLSDADQKAWIDAALKLLAKNSSLAGLSYWVNVGGSTELWDGSGKPRSGVEVLRDWYAPRMVYGFVRDDLGKPLGGVSIHTSYDEVMSNEQGFYRIPLSIRGDAAMTLSAAGFKTKMIEINSKDSWVDLRLTREKQDILYRVRKILYLMNPWKATAAPRVL